jgi:DNA-binding winged helix-turn-helix (wHTH) protein
MDAFTELLTWRFDDFLLDQESRALYRLNPGGGRTVVPLRSRAFEILCLLIDRRGEFVVSKQEIMEAVWSNALVAESNLTVQMAALRRVLDAGRARESCIQTVPGRGYRFVLPITQQRQALADPALAPPRLSIVVLPFEDLSGDPRDGRLADAITNDLTAILRSFPMYRSPRVRPPMRTMAGPRT